VFVVVAAALALVGALVSAVATASGTRELLVPLVLLPLMVPVMIAAAGATEPLVVRDPTPAGLAGWLVVLGLYGGIFALVAVGVFDALIED
jgi:heme exporter protein B